MNFRTDHFNFQLMEANVTLRVRNADKGLVESLVGRAQTDYKNKIKKDVTLKIDQDNYLSPDTCGGVELVAVKGRIKVCPFSHPDFFKALFGNDVGLV